MKQLKEIGKFIIFMAIVAGVGWFCYEAGRLARRFEPKPPEKIPTVKEVQTMLVNKGYDIGPYGIDGRLADCNTVQAWKLYERDELFNEYAAVYMTPSGAPRKEVITHRVRNPPSERSK